jgi:hypothetical protein
MNHDAASEKLLELAYGDLPEREARAVEAHAAGCPACRDELAGMRETRALMALLPVEPPPERGMGIVLAAAREAAAGRARKATLLPRWLWAGGIGAVAAAAVAVVSWQLAKSSPEGGLRERGADLMGRPPAVAFAPAPERREPAEPEAERAKEAPAIAEAPAASPPAKPAAAPRVTERAVQHSLKREASKREASTESMAAAEPAASGAGRAPAGAGSLGGATWERAEPAPPPPPRTRASEEAPAQAFADAERVPAAPAPEPAPAPRGAQKARSMAPAERKAAAPAASKALEEDRAELGGTETRDFAGCPGERRRVVERDGDGRVVRYVRVGDRRTVEQRYDAGGRLRSAFAIEDGVQRALPLDAPGLVRDARDAGIDAPPRCSP